MNSNRRPPASERAEPPSSEGVVFGVLILASVAAFAVAAVNDPALATDNVCTFGLGFLPLGSLSTARLALCLQQPELSVFLAYDWLFIAVFVLTGCLAVRQCAASGRRTSRQGSRPGVALFIGRWGALMVTLYFLADTAENLLLISQQALSVGWLLAVCSTVKWVGAIATIFVVLTGITSLCSTIRAVDG